MPDRVHPPTADRLAIIAELQTFELLTHGVDAAALERARLVRWRSEPIDDGRVRVTFEVDVGDHQTADQLLEEFLPHLAASDTSRAVALTRASDAARATVLRVPGETPKDRRKRVIATNIRRFRTAAKLTQGALAERIGVDRSHVVRWEGAVWEPGAEHLEELADVFGVPVFEFYRETTAAA
jgi:DNA-binding transcriptional regulator YiaG